MSQHMLDFIIISQFSPSFLLEREVELTSNTHNSDESDNKLITLVQLTNQESRIELDCESLMNGDWPSEVTFLFN